ncbi:winged helix-turn-helix transcriptional regulator [Micromonospora sp. NBC_00617]|uniref:winged helix-turn-helix transcriptional regulator n=1 Tax=Micromonospora sp. NBC_00617 TaxID=2903587 RepID=UPI003868399A
MLQTLECDGMLTREVLTAIPQRVEYSLTPLGAGSPISCAASRTCWRRRCPRCGPPASASTARACPAAPVARRAPVAWCAGSTRRTPAPPPPPRPRRV